MENLSELEKILGYEFKHKHLLQQALTHSSHSARLTENYERLEFLGDRVLGYQLPACYTGCFPMNPKAVCRSGIRGWFARKQWQMCGQDFVS